LATSTLEKTATLGIFSPRMAVADQLTVARICAAPLIVILFVVDFPHHDYWATALFAVAMATDWLDGRLARRSGSTSALGSLLDPIADKVLVLSVMIVLVGRGVFPGWMVAAIVAREFLVSGLRRSNAAPSCRHATSASSRRGRRPWRPGSADSRPRAPSTRPLRGGRSSSPWC
jgi:CDP-diacylglycerol--glycerol-3-phosphate 3-phosphatidyltransferase